MIRAIIIDDEQGAQVALNSLIREHCPEVEVVAIASNVDEGIARIDEHHPDVIFLDIEMPEKNGFNLLEHYKEYDFSVIFTTAYQEYAIKAIRFCALDYLLKPVRRDELVDAIERIGKLRYSSKQLKSLLDNMNTGKVDSIVLNSYSGFVHTKISEIVRFEADSNYTEVFFRDGTKLLMSKTLRNYEELLEEEGFFRCHRTHLVNLNYVKDIVKYASWNLRLENGEEVPISRRKKDAAVAALSDKE